MLIQPEVASHLAKAPQSIELGEGGAGRHVSSGRNIFQLQWFNICQLKVFRHFPLTPEIVVAHRY